MIDTQANKYTEGRTGRLKLQRQNSRQEARHTLSDLLQAKLTALGFQQKGLAPYTNGAQTG